MFFTYNADSIWSLDREFYLPPLDASNGYVEPLRAQLVNEFFVADTRIDEDFETFIDVAEQIHISHGSALSWRCDPRLTKGRVGRPYAVL